MNLFENFVKIFTNNETKKVSKNFGSLLVLQVANFLLPLLTLPYLVRILGTELFGLVMFAQAFVLFFNVFVDFGFNLSVTREISINRDNKNSLSQIFSSVFFIKFFLVLVSIVIISLIIYFVPRFNADPKIYFLSFGIVIGQALFPVWFFQGVEKMSVITAINLIAKVIFTLLIFLLVKEKSDYLLVPIFNSIGFIIAGLIGLLYALKEVKFVRPKKIRIKTLFNDSSQLFVSNLSVILYTSANTIILGLFTNNTMVGVYASMEKLVLAVKNLYTPLFQAIFPWIATKKAREIVKITSILIFPILIFGIFVFLIIFFFSTSILQFIYNDNLITQNNNVFRILGLIAVLSGINMLFNMLFLSALKKYKLRMKIIVLAGIVNIILALILVKNYDIYGIAVTVTFTELLLLVLGWYNFNKIKNEEAYHTSNSYTGL